MWDLSSIRIVPRPSPRCAAIALTVLAVYYAFRDLNVVLFGRETHPIALAIALRFGLVIIGNFLAYDAGQSPVRETRIRILALYLGLFATSLLLMAPNPQLVQHIWSFYIFLFAVLQMAFVRFAPGDIAQLPSIWASTHRMSPQALDAAAIGMVLVALTSEALIAMGHEQAWMLFVTVGALMLNFLTNWVIVLMIASDTSHSD